MLCLGLSYLVLSYPVLSCLEIVLWFSCLVVVLSWSYLGLSCLAVVLWLIRLVLSCLVLSASIMYLCHLVRTFEDIVHEAIDGTMMTHHL